ncbi:MAG: hypothetical protein K2W96_16870 [Gemmataceae bacterium]|nr:hypothetical protein [Gemmataceae bacterium]
MLDREEIRAFRNREPFVPFQVRTKKGETFDIVNPGLIMVCRWNVLLGILGPYDPEIAEEQVMVPIADIDSIRDLPQESPAQAPTAS